MKKYSRNINIFFAYRAGRVSLLGQTYTTDNELNINNNKWILDSMLGNKFEEHLFNVLSKELEDYYDLGASIEHTPRARDNGKDIIIKSPVSLENILGTNFYIRDRQQLIIYIECKSSDSSKIPYNSFAGNLSRIKNEHVGYYVLVTNTTIVPYSYYQFKEEAEKLGIEFVLTDQYLLQQYLTQNNAMIGELETSNNFNKVYIEYQADSCIIEAKKAYEIYFWLRNYSQTVQAVSLEINTDRNWILYSNIIDCVIESKKSECVKFIATKVHFDGIDDLIISVRANDVATSIQIKGINLSYNFRPQLTGKENKNLLCSLVDNIKTNSSFQTIFLMGEAGVGKTRIIDEVLSKLSGRNINFFRILAEKGRNVIPKLQKVLVQGEMLSISGDSGSLKDLLLKIDTNYRKCVIIIDDFHNASKDLLNDIRLLLQDDISTQLTLLLVGRDDFSVGNLEYFSFLEFFKEKYNEKVFLLKALSDCETLNMISSIVRGIPQFALKKIHSLSNNLPLFIIQVIEYMLDLKLVYLLNRNTVGIENTEFFSSHLYIPQSMEDLYNQRVSCLLKQDGGEIMLQFLHIAACIGNSFSGDFINIFFNGQEKLLATLLERRYIISSSENYSFAHESLYLYLQNSLLNNNKEKQEVGIWLTNAPLIFDKFDFLKKGQLYMWAGNKKKAIASFAPAISDIQHIENYSSININQDYYNYLEEIYNLCTTYEQKKRVIVCKIYIALHYHTPYVAANTCNWAEQKLKSSKYFQNDAHFKFYLKEQMAHSYINAGLLRKGESILMDLLSYSILEIEKCDQKAVFDMYDKLSNIYIKYNSFDIAQKYCQLSLMLASKLGDKNLEALSYITTAKLFFYTNNIKSKFYLYKANELLSRENAYRIKCHNDVSLLIMELTESLKDDNINLTNMIIKTEKLRDICIQYNFANSVIRLYMLLAVLYCLFECKEDKYHNTEIFIDKGIDASIKFGISTYIWQFYNLKAIISTIQKQDISIQVRLFDTVLNILKKQNLTYLGNCDLTYGNMMALTNIFWFYRHNTPESTFYKKLSQISTADSIDNCDFNCSKATCAYQCNTSLKDYQKEWARFSKAKDASVVLFGTQIEKYPLISINGYFIILS